MDFILYPIYFHIKVYAIWLIIGVILFIFTIRLSDKILDRVNLYGCIIFIMVPLYFLYGGVHDIKSKDFEHAYGKMTLIDETKGTFYKRIKVEYKNDDVIVYVKINELNKYKDIFKDGRNIEVTYGKESEIVVEAH